MKIRSILKRVLTQWAVSCTAGAFWQEEPPKPKKPKKAGVFGTFGFVESEGSELP